MTFDHMIDRDIVAYCAKQSLAYLGMIGSKKKVEVTRHALLTVGILNEEEVQGIDWPMGIDIMVETPEEIAIAILAKLIDVRAKLAKPRLLHQVKSALNNS